MGSFSCGTERRVVGLGCKGRTASVESGGGGSIRITGVAITGGCSVLGPSPVNACYFCRVWFGAGSRFCAWYACQRYWNC